MRPFAVNCQSMQTGFLQTNFSLTIEGTNYVVFNSKNSNVTGGVSVCRGGGGLRNFFLIFLVSSFFYIVVSFCTTEYVTLVSPSVFLMYFLSQLVIHLYTCFVLLL